MRRRPLGQRELNRCPSSGVSDGPHPATMRLDNRTRDRESQPGALRLGGKERIKDFVRLSRGQANARVANRN